MNEKLKELFIERIVSYEWKATAVEWVLELMAESLPTIHD